MTASARMLYTYLVVNADDDGFVKNVKAVQKGCGCHAAALHQLLQSQYLIAFTSGVCVIKHWHLMNKVSPSKYKKTLYTAEKSLLALDDDGIYRFKGELLDDEMDKAVDRMLSTGQLSSGQSPYNKCANDANTPRVIDPSSLNKAAVYTADFENLWAMYPKKINKYKAFLAYQKAKKSGVADEDIKAGIIRYKQYIDVNDIKATFVKHGSTFFNQRAWEDDYHFDMGDDHESIDDEFVGKF